MINLALGLRSPAIEQGNKRINKFILITICCMFFYGFFLPTDWQHRFGFLGEIITWAAVTTPGTVKLAELSPMPELVKGFLGLSSWVVFLFAILLARKDPIEERIRFAFTRPRWPFLKTFLFIYLIACPATVLMFWVVYFVPIPIDMTGGVSWGGKLLVEMITNRYALAVYGAIVTVGMGLACFLLFVALVGPILLLFKGEQK